MKGTLGRRRIKLVLKNWSWDNSFPNTGCAMSGLIADAKTLIDKARVETQVSNRFFVYAGLLYNTDVKDRVLSSLCVLQNHWFTYNETMTVESVTQAVSNLALQFGEEDADPGAMVTLPWLKLNFAFVIHWSSLKRCGFKSIPFLLSLESSFWCRSAFWRCGWERTAAVSPLYVFSVVCNNKLQNVCF